MKTIITVIFAVLVFLQTPRETLAQGTLENYQFYSPALGREMSCRLYLPKEYNPTNPGTRLPVIYFLHGATVGYEGYDPLFLLFDNLISLKIIKPAILVIPDGLAPPYNGSFYTNSVLYGNFEDYLIEDLIPFIDGRFHTIAERTGRGIMGASMGSYGAIKLAMKHPGLFVGVAGHSGPLNTLLFDYFIPTLIAEDGGVAPFHWSPGPEKPLTNLTFTMAGAFSPNLSQQYLVDFPLDSLGRTVPEIMDRWNRENVSNLARTFDPSSNLPISFDCGTLDEYELYYQNRAFADTLKKYNITHTYQEYLGTHVTGLPVRVTLSFAWFNQLFHPTGIGTSGLSSSNDWSISPNPANEFITIHTTNVWNSMDHCTIHLNDISGRLVLTRKLGPGENRVSVKDLPKGTYFASIWNGESIQNYTTLIIR